MIRAIKHNKAEGWIRGRFAMTPEMEAEISELRARSADQSLALETAKALTQVVPEDLAFGEDVFIISTIVEYYD
jgi:hypothetical protein